MQWTVMKCIARAYSFTCALLTYWHVQSQSYQHKNVLWQNIMGFPLLFYGTVSNANDIFLWFNNDNKWLEHAMTNNNHIFRSTANLKKKFNMCLPATSITLSIRYLNWLMHASLSYSGSSSRFSSNKSFRCCTSLILWCLYSLCDKFSKML